MASIRLEYDIIPHSSALAPALRQLVDEAHAAADLAYAPYSGFRVGAAVLLANGEIVRGSNQENAAYPAGTCAERVALYTAAIQYPDISVAAIAITYSKREIDPALKEEHLSPCGICRQVISEVAQRQQTPIHMLLCSAGNTILSVKDAKDLLPFSFGSKML